MGQNVNMFRWKKKVKVPAGKSGDMCGWLDCIKARITRIINV